MYKVSMFSRFYQRYLSRSPFLRTAVFCARRQTNERNLTSGKFSQMTRGVMDCLLTHGGWDGETGVTAWMCGKFSGYLNFTQTFVRSRIASEQAAFCVFRKTF